MSNKHTPEPWFVREFGTHTDRPSYFVMMSQTKGLFQTSDKSLSNRIVACVNACAGMNDPEAEIENLKKQVQAHRNSAYKASVANADLIAEITRMKENMREVVQFLEHVQYEISPIGRRATVLLAKIKGGAQ